MTRQAPPHHAEPEYQRQVADWMVRLLLEHFALALVLGLVLGAIWDKLT